MKNAKILIAEDDELTRENLAELLTACGYLVKGVEDGTSAMNAFLAETFDLVITDLKMPPPDGLELLKLVKEMNPDNEVILMTGYGTVDSAVNAMKLGAFDYIAKPLKDDLVKVTVSRALSFIEEREENTSSKPHPKDNYDFGKMLGFSDPMKKVFETIEKVSASDSTILICGESGTGKELVARAIHLNSERKEQLIVPVNCGAIPEELLESELFGHEKGAFTGAIRNRMGRFELAQGGTIFLDEIGDMSPTLQVKMLRVIQEKEFERIGGIKTIHADVRIIAATNQNLEEAVAGKKFREDLFYRINVIPIHLPPLRERGADIGILASHFLRKFNMSKKKNIFQISPDAMSYFFRYSWPGNVRELENLIEMLVVMKEEGEIGIPDLPPKLQRLQKEEGGIDITELPRNLLRLPEAEQQPSPRSVNLAAGNMNFNELVSQYEKELLLKAMRECNGVKNKAAKLLNLNRTTLVEKLKRFNLSDSDLKDDEKD
ncbi:MAG: sigma-54 dependent transcriptional regulator [Syntrophaceae bacterium]|nr:sigma-54 dependent transcriptional regulator [Syntrophaceae bacterium]